MVGTFPAAAKCISRACLLLALFVGLFSSYAWPQTQLATVFGTINDPSGAVIPGAQITIINQGTGLKRATLTDMTGQYHLAGLPIGNYALRTEKEGFQTQTREGIALTSASDVMINLSLIMGVHPEQLTVSAGITGIDNTTSTVGGILTEKNLAELPLNGRDLFNAASLAPGVAPTPSSAPSLLSTGKVGQVSINGMRPSWTNVLIDGMDANDPVFGFSPAGASGLFLGLNELAEVRVSTQTFSAEYGGNGGGVIEAVTKSGSNHFHGSLFELHRNAAFDARNYFDLGSRPIPPFVRNQFGASIGGPLVHDRTFFFANYEGFREVQASTAIATAPNALAHRGLLPSASNPGGCSNATPSGCVAVRVDPRVQQFLELLPPSNGTNNGDGTGDLITADKGETNGHHGMFRVDHNFSNTHSLFARYIIDDSSSLVPYFGEPPGTYVPGFPTLHQARNQYFTVQDRRNLGHEVFNELRFAINRTTASSSIVNTLPGLSISLLADRPFGMLNIAGMSLIGNSPEIPLGDFSTVYQVQDQLSRTNGRHTLKFGAEFRRIQSNGPLDFAVNGLYTFQDLSPFGFSSQSNNPALEFFLQALPLSYVGVNPSRSDSDRGYRQSVVSGFVQDFWRLTSRLTVNAGLRYDFYSNPTEAHGRLSVIRNPAKDSGPTVGKLFAATPQDLLSPQLGFAWVISCDGKAVLRGGAGFFRDQLPVILFGADRFLPPFFGINTLVFPSFPSPQTAVLSQPIFFFSTTYHPKFPYALQYNLNLQREVARDMIVSANSFQLSVSKQYAHNLSWQLFYTWSHSIDDASTNFSPIEAVNEPPTTQDPFDRKGSRGRSGFDIRHNFVANVIYELPFRHGRGFGGWQLSAVARVHSNLPFSPVLSFDNADLQSLLTSERPDLVGNPHTGVCPNGSKVGTASCWFNPSSFALPPPGQFGNAGRNILRGPGFAQFDLSLQKSFHLREGRELTFGAEAYNLFNHPNLAVPSNTQSPLTLGGNGDTVFRDAAGNLANNVGRIFTTVGTGRQIQFDGRFTF